MKKEIEKFENHCDNLICGVFETIVLPSLKKAALKIGVEAIEEMNNCYFFKVGNKWIIERDFHTISKENERFFKTYIIPIAKSRHQYPKKFKFSMY